MFNYSKIDPIYIPLGQRVHTGFTEDLPKDREPTTETIKLERPKTERIMVDYDFTKKFPPQEVKAQQQPINVYVNINETFDIKEE